MWLKTMFTGIIKHPGKLKKKEKDNTTFTFTTAKVFHKRIYEGVSVAINGACLTVTKKDKNSFSVGVIPETLQKTMLGKLKLRDLVNLELPTTPETFLSGHIIQGHIDGIGRVKKLKKDGNSRLITVQVNPSLIRYIVAKGSIAINGVSLTVISATKNSFTVGIIPYTLQHTMFFTLKKGDSVNIEVDILAKYVENLLKKRG